MLRASCALVVLGACGRLRFDPHSDAGAVAVPDGASPDALCAWGPFQTPVLLNVVNSPADDAGPGLTLDERTLAFHSNRSGASGQDIFIATRANRTDDFGAPTLFAPLNSAADEWGPTWRFDGLEIVFASRRTSFADIWHSVRSDTASPFGAPTLAFTTVATIDRNAPALSPDGLELYYHYSTNGVDIYHASRAQLGDPFVGDFAVPELETAASDDDPTISHSGLELFFRSDRSGVSALYVARRASTSVPFDPPTIVDLGGFDCLDPEISADDSQLFCANALPGDLYVATRTCQ